MLFQSPQGKKYFFESRLKPFPKGLLDNRHSKIQFDVAQPSRLPGQPKQGHLFVPKVPLVHYRITIMQFWPPHGEKYSLKQDWIALPRGSCTISPCSSTQDSKTVWSPLMYQTQILLSKHKSCMGILFSQNYTLATHLSQILSFPRILHIFDCSLTNSVYCTGDRAKCTYAPKVPLGH